ncbi:hypothetical protein LSCM4_07538 [Leishmania orientalis]|uniref:Uncharacterized protein n=1 Tax=Leishmania orientalis TaxID=2249476 RepID=A0A836GTF4_9TRYP|nr:hypothetical protein LSCM4_07538 [Leishmania orientalis]
MGGNVSVLLEANAPVPSIVISTQHEVRDGPDLGSAASATQLPSLPSRSRVVERCPKIRVMAADKAQEVLGGSGSASVAWESKRTPPPLSAEESPVLLVRDCAAPEAFTTSRTYIPVMNAIVAYAEERGKADAAATENRRGSSGRVICPIGVDFDPTLCLGNRLSRGEARAACAEYCKLFFTHLIAALENVGKHSKEEALSTRTSTSSYSMGMTAAAATEAVVPQRFFLLYVDARSGQIDDATGQWLASSLIMNAVRRTRPYALVSARTKASGGSGSGSGSEDGFMSYFSPDVKADMVWASLQHLLLTHNNMSLQGVKTVLETLLAEDAMHDVLLHQQGVDAKAQKAVEVITAVTEHRLFPRQGSKLLPQLYLVDVRHNQYDDAEVKAFQRAASPSAGNQDESAAGQARPSIKSFPKLPVSRAQRSNHNSTQEHMRLTDELTFESVLDSPNGASPAPAGASSAPGSASQSLEFSLETPKSSTPTSPTLPEAPQAQKASLPAPPPPATDVRGGREGAAPVQAKPKTASPLMPRNRVRKVLPAHEKFGTGLRSPRPPPEKSRGDRFAKVDAAETAIDEVPDSVVLNRSARRLSSVSSRSETRATAPVAIPPASATQQRAALLQSPRSLSARKPATPLPRVDAVELQRAYEVLKAQRPESARKASAAAMSSHRTSPRQRMSPPLSLGQSTPTRARRLPELYREEDELDDAEMEVHSLTPHLRSHPHTRSQRGSRSGHDPGSGRAEGEAWLDEVFTQSHGDGTSPALSIGSQRRFYDIPSLAPPEPFFAASAARVPTAMRTASLHKRHDTPAQAASRRASPESVRWPRKTVYGDAQPRVYSGCHLGRERLAWEVRETVPVTEARARERMRERAEQRGMARLTSGRGYSGSARQHQALHLSPSVQTERGVKSGCTSSLSEPQSPSPAPLQPAAAVGAVQEATPSLAPTDPSVALGSTQASSVHHSLHGRAAAAPGCANNSPASQYRQPATTPSMKNTAKRRLPAAGPPHITPRGTLTSQLRKITSQRQRYFLEVEENENNYYARSRQPRRKFRMAHVTVAMRAPWAQPLEMAAARQEQKRCASIGYPRSSRSTAYREPIMAATSPLRRGDTAPQREWDSPARGTSSDESLVPTAAHNQGSGHPAAASTPEYNENGIELVHMKLRTRA